MRVRRARVLGQGLPAVLVRRDGLEGKGDVATWGNGRVATEARFRVFTSATCRPWDAASRRNHSAEFRKSVVFG
jgi:hypothetical protein